MRGAMHDINDSVPRLDIIRAHSLSSILSVDVEIFHGQLLAVKYCSVTVSALSAGHF